MLLILQYDAWIIKFYISRGLRRKVEQRDQILSSCGKIIETPHFFCFCLKKGR